MNACRGLNVAQHWLMRDVDRETHMKVRAMMVGVLETTIAAPKPGGRRKVPTPWWWGNDDEVSAGNTAAAAMLSRGTTRTK